MKQIKILFIFSLILMNISTSIAGDSNKTKVATTGAAFLEIEAGARAIGMGGAFTAVANDASATYWNPAGIVNLNSNELLFNHTEWLVDIKYDYLSFVTKISPMDAIAVTYTGLNVGDMEITTVDEPEGIGETFTSTSMSIGACYARKLTDRFSIGVTGKYVSEKISSETASGLAFDLGTVFKTQFKDMKIGMSISNFGNKMKMTGEELFISVDPYPIIEGNNDEIPAYLDTEEWAMPLILRIGLSADFWNTPLHRLTWAVDAMHPSNNLESMNVGMEYAIREFIFLRGGMTNLFLKDGEETFACGGGLNYTMNGIGGIAVDYAFSDFGILNEVHRFSLSLKF